jgi:hypothetical protein
MRYRALSDTGDYQFGRAGIFLTNTPQAVAQAILTRFHLWTNEWFLDAQEGTPYLSDIIGHGTQGTRDIAVKERILGTPGVTSILDYQSSVTADRKMTVTALVDTQYGVTAVTLQA